MTDTDKFNDVYLNLEIRKSEGKTDEYGNYIFEVEASNENVDLQDQIVLQNALMESKDEFLKGGVISYDHLHKTRDAKGRVISDPSMVIGEPIDVKFDTKTKSTVVTGKLYATNEKAKEIIKMLKAGSTRVRASVGGIFPEVVKNVKTGVEKITHVLWNDLALTTSPVNNTVGNAVFAKALTSYEFVNSLPYEMKKSLYAGYGTDTDGMSGGRALIPEDTNTKTIDAENEKAADAEKEIIKGMCELLKSGELEGEDAAINYLTENGIEKEKAGSIIREIITQGGEMMKKSFSNSVSALLKSLTGGNQGEDEDDIKKHSIEKADAEDTDDDNELDFDDESDEDEDDDTDDDEENEDDIDDEDEEEDDEETEDGEEEDEDAVDGSEVLKSLDYELNAMRKSMRDLRKQNNDLGKAVTSLAEMVYAIGSEKLPPKSVLNKSISNSEKTMKKSIAPKGRPTEDDLYRVQCVLAKCVENGTIDMRKSSMISSDMQKCMYTGKPMKQEYYEFLQKELSKEAR